MTPIAKALVAASLLAAAGMVGYEAHQASQLQNQVRTLRQRHPPEPSQMEQWSRERTDATNQVADLQRENEQLQRDRIELPSLRGEVTRLRGESNELARLKTDQAKNENDPRSLEAKALAARVNRLKQWLEHRPDQKIPELLYLNDEDRAFTIASRIPFPGTDGPQSASVMRMAAKDKFVRIMPEAIRRFAKANGDQLPTDMVQLKPHYEALGFPVDNATLQRYQMIKAGSINDVPRGVVVAVEKSTAGDTSDMRTKIALSF